MRKIFFNSLILIIVFSNFSKAQQQDLWTTFSTTNMRTGNSVGAICESYDGALWFGTYEGGVHRYESGEWTTFTTTDGLANDCIYSICESSDGALWFGTKGGGASRYYCGEWKTFTIDDGLADNVVHIICESYPFT